MVLKGFDFSICRLAQCTHAEFYGIAVPDLLLDREHLSEMGAGAAQPRSQTVDGLLLSKAVRNRDGEGR